MPLASSFKVHSKMSKFTGVCATCFILKSSQQDVKVRRKLCHLLHVEKFAARCQSSQTIVPLASSLKVHSKMSSSQKIVPLASSLKVHSKMSKFTENCAACFIFKSSLTARCQGSQKIVPPASSLLEEDWPESIFPSSLPAAEAPFYIHAASVSARGDAQCV